MFSILIPALLTSDVQSYYIGMRLYIDKDGYDGWQNTDSTAVNILFSGVDQFPVQSQMDQVSLTQI